jgi:molecular chaperone DnaK
LSALLLKKVVADYAEQFGQPQSVVITWPANYRNEQREATKDAAARAGLKVEHFIEEPTAAALYYATDTALDGKYLVYDFGGGTFDVTLIDAHGNTITPPAVLHPDLGL